MPIPKKTGGTRILGVPTVSDRIAQTVVKKVLEPILEPVFDQDSFGYRPGKSAHDAIAVTRQRCWRYDWVVEFDIKGLFDHIDHGRLMKALRHHCTINWVLLYVERWLKAPLQQRDGELVPRDMGTPQGGVISPLLANLFLHYAFDGWVRRAMPGVPFCRYADDGLLHCKSRRQAEWVMARIIRRFKECGLEINSEKSRIVYCKDRNRHEEHEAISFDFLGFTFRPRRCVSERHDVHPNFLPAISRASMKSLNREIRSWHVQLKNDKSLNDLSNMFNAKLRGWFVYYGRFLSIGNAPNLAERERVSGSVGTSQVQASFRTQEKGVAVFETVRTEESEAFCTLGTWMSSLRLSGRSRMSREVHVRFSEGLRVKLSRSTQPYISIQSDFVYLAVILDLFSRKAVGYAISRNIDTALSLAALIAAIVNRKPPKGIIHHSDQGVQYAAHDYVDILLEHGFQISMARKGNPYDNATAESFMKTLKTEEVYLWEYRTLADVQLRLPYFIEQVYNHKRLHSSLGYLPPVEFEELFLKTLKPCPAALTQAV